MTEREEVERRTRTISTKIMQADDADEVEQIVTNFAMSERARVWEAVNNALLDRAIAAHRAGADSVARFGAGSVGAAQHHFAGDALDRIRMDFEASAEAEKEGSRGEG